MSGIYLYNGAGPFPISIDWPWGMTLDGQGNLYFADFLNLRVRQIQGNVSPVDFTPTPIRQGYLSTPATTPVELENDGNAPLNLVSIAAGTNAALQQSSLDASLQPCAVAGQILAPDADCWLDPVFAPAATPALTGNQTEIGNIDIAANSTPSLASANSPLQVEVVGIATPVNSTTTAIVSNPNPSGFGQSVSFTATVTTGAGTGNLSGAVAFYDGTTLLGPSVPLNTGSATGQAIAIFTISTLAVGTHTITAVYDNTNDPDHFTSSGILTQSVLEGTVTTLTASEKTANLGDTVLFTATVSAANGGGYPLDGSVTFTIGATILCTQNINASGVATCSASALTQGVNQIAATYTPASTAEIQPSIGLLSLDVQAASSTQVSLGGIQAQANTGIFYGNPVTIVGTVTVSGTIASGTGSGSGPVPATGSVLFFDGSQQIGTAPLSGAQAQASFTTTTLAVGSHSITASYQGDPNYKASVSAPISVTVNQAQTAVTVSALPAIVIAGRSGHSKRRHRRHPGSCYAHWHSHIYQRRWAHRVAGQLQPAQPPSAPHLLPASNLSLPLILATRTRAALSPPLFPSRCSSQPRLPRLLPVPIPPSCSLRSLSQQRSPATEAFQPVLSHSAQMGPPLEAPL